MHLDIDSVEPSGREQVTRVRVRYVAPARSDDLVRVVTPVARVQSRMVTLRVVSSHRADIDALGGRGR